MIKSSKNKSGFTMIEALVAITILLISVLGPLSLIAKGLGDALFAKNQITAFYLAEEGLEMVINKRDQFVFSAPSPTDNVTGSGWIEGYGHELGSIGLNSLCFNSTTGCDMSISSNQAVDCSNSPNPPGCQLYLPIDADGQATGFYDSTQNNNSQLTIFRRQIIISSSDPYDEVQVKVIVYWNNRGVPKQLILIGHLSRSIFT